MKTTQIRRLVQSCALNPGEVKPGHPGSGLGGLGVTLRESVGLYDVEERLHQVEEDADGSRFEVGHRLVNSRGHITEIQLSRGRQPPRLRLQLEFRGRSERPEQQDEPATPHRTGPSKLGLKLLSEAGGGARWLLIGRRAEESGRKSKITTIITSVWKKCPDGKSAAFQVLPTADTLVLGMVPCEPADASSGLLWAPGSAKSRRDERACRFSSSSICEQ